MFKKIIALFVLLSLAAQTSIAQENTESFTSVSQGDPAPYTGYLFTPDALAKIYADIEQQEKTKQLEFETKIKAIQLEIGKIQTLHKIEVDNKDLLLEKITIEKNKTILQLTEKVETQKWFIVGAFVAGVLITGSTVYYFSTVTK